MYMKRILSLLMLVVFVMTASAEVTWSYNEDTKTLTFSGTGAMRNGTSSSQPWGDYAAKAVTVVLEEGVTTIGSYAFNDFTKLETLIIEGDLIGIGSYAFKSVPKLKTVEYKGTSSPGQIKTAAKLPSTVKFICSFDVCGTDWGAGEYVVPFNNNGVECTLHYYVEGAVLEYTVYGEVGDAVVTIENEQVAPFYDASVVTVGEGVSVLGEGAFSDFEAIETLSLPSTLETISSAAFTDSEALSSVSIAAKSAPELVGTVFSSVIAENKSILNIPLNETTIESYRTAGYETYFILPSLDCICGESLEYSYNNGVLTITGTGAMTSYKSAEVVPWNNRRLEITKVVLPEGLTTIGAYAFHGCSNLTSIDIPSNVTTVGKRAFGGCSHLEGIELPVALTSLASDAFLNTTVSRGESDCVINNIAVYDHLPEGAVKVLNIVEGVANGSITDDYSGLTFQKAAYKRTFGARNTGTIVLPFNVERTAAPALKFYKIKESVGNRIVFEEVSGVLEANTPYLWENTASSDYSSIKSDETETTEFTISVAGLESDAVGEWQLIGALSKTTVSDGSDYSYYAYRASDKMLINYTGGLTVHPYRAYFKGPKYGASVQSNMPERSFTIELNREDGTTAIEDVVIDSEGELSFGAAGDGVVYDLSGRPVENPSNGIYIVNGKKMYVK